MAISSWLCTKNSKTMFVKVVHAGGHVALYDRPILAAELLRQNPKCCVAHPIVFQQPWAIVSPETTLVLGQKYYIVPLSTIRKLQLKNSPIRTRQYQNQIRNGKQNTKVDNKVDSTFRKKKGCLEKSGKNGCSLKDSCSWCMFKGIKLKVSRDSTSQETIKSSSSSASYEAKKLNRKTNNELMKKKRKKNNEDFGVEKEDSAVRLSSFDNWQPRLESIREE